MVDLSAYLSSSPLTLISAPPLQLVGTFGSVTFLGGRAATVNYDVANGKVFLNNFHLGSGAGALAGSTVPEPSSLALVGLTLALCSSPIGWLRRTRRRYTPDRSLVAESSSVVHRSGDFSLVAINVWLHVCAARVAVCFTAALLFVGSYRLCVRADAGREFALAPIDTLPNAPSTYSMRDWRQTATDFDTLAFNTTATGQYLPLVRIDNTFQPPQTQTWYGLPSYVGETRTFGETGEPIHEAVASLAAVWGGTLSRRRQIGRSVRLGRDVEGVLRRSQFPVHRAEYAVFVFRPIGLVRNVSRHSDVRDCRPVSE